METHCCRGHRNPALSTSPGPPRDGSLPFAFLGPRGLVPPKRAGEVREEMSRQKLCAYMHSQLSRSRAGTPALSRTPWGRGEGIWGPHAASPTQGSAAISTSPATVTAGSGGPVWGQSGMQTHRGSLCRGRKVTSWNPDNAQPRGTSGCQLFPEAPPARPACPPTALSLGTAICSPGKLGKGRGWAGRLPLELGSTHLPSLPGEGEAGARCHPGPRMAAPLRTSPRGTRALNPAPRLGQLCFPSFPQGPSPSRPRQGTPLPTNGEGAGVPGAPPGQQRLPGGPKPAPQSSTLTLVRVGGGQDGTVLPLHLLHVLRDLVNEATDLLHLCTRARQAGGDPGRGLVGPGLAQTGAGGQVQGEAGPGFGRRGRGEGGSGGRDSNYPSRTGWGGVGESNPKLCSPLSFSLFSLRMALLFGVRALGLTQRTDVGPPPALSSALEVCPRRWGVLAPTCSKNSSMKPSRSTVTVTSSSSSLSLACTGVWTHERTCGGPTGARWTWGHKLPRIYTQQLSSRALTTALRHLGRDEVRLCPRLPATVRPGGPRGTQHKERGLACRIGDRTGSPPLGRGFLPLPSCLPLPHRTGVLPVGPSP